MDEDVEAPGFGCDAADEGGHFAARGDVAGVGDDVAEFLGGGLERKIVVERKARGTYGGSRGFLEDVGAASDDVDGLGAVGFEGAGDHKADASGGIAIRKLICGSG